MMNEKLISFLNIMSNALAQNLKNISAQIKKTAQQVNRAPTEVCLLVVTKTISAEQIQKILDLGITNLGENRVQEADGKFPLLRGNFTKHLIGHLQTNKAKMAAEIFDIIHSIDSIRIALALEKACAELDKILRVFIEVNLSGETTKFGVHANFKNDKNLQELISEIKKMPHLKLVGLMTVPPPVSTQEENRPFFRELKKLANKFQLSELSMGMSGDYSIAIEEGATIVRLGSAIFGERR